MPRVHNGAAPIDLSTGAIWLRVLACLAVVVVSCGVKNYLAVLVSGTALCPYLCPSLFSHEMLFSFPSIERFFDVQRWVQEGIQAFAEQLFSDRWNLTTSLLTAPLIEEAVFRGPMFLARGRMHSHLWWLMGAVLAILFALSHGRSGLAMLPLFVFGICSLWLIAKTHNFWPSVALHFLHNFFFSSVLVYQSLLGGD